MSKQYFFVIAVLLCLLCMTSCERNKSQKPAVNIPGNYSSDAESEYELPPFVNSEIGSEYNLALSGKAFADSVSSDYPNYTADMLNDGDRLTRWASGRAGNADSPSSFGIVFEESKVFDIIILFWDASLPEEGGFSIELDGIHGDAVYTLVRKDNGDGCYTDYVIFGSSVNATGFTVTCYEPYYSPEYGALKEYPSCYEIEVYSSFEMSDGLASDAYAEAAENVVLF